MPVAALLDWEEYFYYCTDSNETQSGKGFKRIKEVSSDLRLKIQQVLPSVFTKYMHLFDTFHLMKRAAATFSSKTFSPKS